MDTSLAKPASVEMNGSDSLNDKNVRKRSAKSEEVEEVNEAFYCTKCEKIVDSFAEHTASFHANDDVIFKVPTQSFESYRDLIGECFRLVARM